MARRISRAFARSHKARGRAIGHRSQKENHLRREYCKARNRADAIGRALGELTGTHKKRSPHRKRHVKCRTSR